MKMNIHNLFRNENGSTMVISALSITAIIMFASLALDFGIVYSNESRVQNALDASTLAAGRFLPVNENDESGKEKIRSTVAEYLNKNGMVDLSTLNIDFKDIKNGEYTKIEAQLAVNSELNFAKIIGVNSISVTKSAGVNVVPSIKISDVIPLAVKKGNLDDCIASGDTTNITLKYGGGGGTEGDFGAIDLDGVNGGGASDYERWLTYGYTKDLEIGEALLPVENGNMAEPTSTAINSRYNSCTHFSSYGGCNYLHFEPSCPRILKTPVIQYVNSNTVKIVAFAAFVMNNPAQGTSGYVSGSFINLVIPGTPAETATDLSSADYGIYSLKLSK